jgi:hypothetical protein
MAEKTIRKFVARTVQFYEQEQGEPSGSPLPALYVIRGRDASPTSLASTHTLLELINGRRENRPGRTSLVGRRFRQGTE